MALTYRSKSRGKLNPSITQEWIIPVNPKYYDINKAFLEKDSILWK